MLDHLSCNCYTYQRSGIFRVEAGDRLSLVDVVVASWLDMAVAFNWI